MNPKVRGYDSMWGTAEVLAERKRQKSLWLASLRSRARVRK